MIVKVAIFEHMAKIVYSIKLVQCGCGLHESLCMSILYLVFVIMNRTSWPRQKP